MSRAREKQRGTGRKVTRRECLGLGASAGLAAVLSEGAGVAAEKKAAPGEDRLRIDYPGQRYQAVVPDTLDLAERAALALNGLGGTSDPAMGGLHYFHQYFVCRPPYMNHHGADTTCTPKYMESFPMMRLMCGSGLYAERELVQRQMLVGQIADGLYWNRFRADRPWACA